MNVLRTIYMSIYKYNGSESAHHAWDSPFNPLMVPIALPIVVFIFLAVIDVLFGTNITHKLLSLI